MRTVILSSLILLFLIMPNDLKSQVGGKDFGNVIPYPPLREADVMWSKRVWRVMDLREKINHPLYYPVEPSRDRRSLSQLIYQSILEKELTAYNTIDDEFSTQLSFNDFVGLTTEIETVSFDDEEGNPQTKDISIPFEPSNIKRYRIKEDWFFDKQRSVLECRIIGMCPVIEKFDQNGDYKGELPLFWIYFPETRNILIHEKVFNRFNEAERRTFDDVLGKRMFSSYLYKESNVYDRKIQDYKQGNDILLESKQIEDKVFDFEQDLWEY